MKTLIAVMLVAACAVTVGAQQQVKTFEVRLEASKKANTATYSWKDRPLTQSASREFAAALQAHSDVSKVEFVGSEKFTVTRKNGRDWLPIMTHVYELFSKHLLREGEVLTPNDVNGEFAPRPVSNVRIK